MQMQRTGAGECIFGAPDNQARHARARPWPHLAASAMDRTSALLPAGPNLELISNPTLRCRRADRPPARGSSALRPPTTTRRS